MPSPSALARVSWMPARLGWCSPFVPLQGYVNDSSVTWPPPTLWPLWHSHNITRAGYQS